jgi:HEAT repeat protein
MQEEAAMTEFFLTQTLIMEPVVNFKMAAQWQAHIHLLGTSDQMIEALGSDDELSAMMAAMALIHLGGDAVPTLLKALGDPDNVLLRQRCIWPLRMIEDARSVEPLIAALTYDEDAKVRRYAAWTLGILGDERAVKPLIDAFDDPDTRVRWDAAVALEKIRPSAVGALLMALYYGAPLMRIGAINALAWMRHPIAPRVLIEMLRDHDVDVRVHAIIALGWLGDTRAVEPLLAMLHDEADEVRMQAAAALGWIRSPQAVTPLVELMNEQVQWVPTAAVEALSQIDSPLAVQALDAAARSGSDTVRQRARQALRLRGLDPDEQVPDQPPERGWLFQKHRQSDLIAFH